MTTDFQWWLLIVGLAIGAGLAWLVLEDRRRADDELADRQIDEESAWIADRLRARGGPPRSDTIVRVLELHRDYLEREPERDDEDWAPDDEIGPDIARSNDRPPAPVAEMDDRPPANDRPRA